LETNKKTVLLQVRQKSEEFEKPLSSMLKFDNESQKKRYFDNLKKIAKIKTLLLNHTNHQFEIANNVFLKITKKLVC